MNSAAAPDHLSQPVKSSSIEVPKNNSADPTQVRFKLACSDHDARSERDHDPPPQPLKPRDSGLVWGTGAARFPLDVSETTVTMTGGPGAASSG